MAAAVCGTLTFTLPSVGSNTTADARMFVCTCFDPFVPASACQPAPVCRLWPHPKQLTRELIHSK